MPLCDKCKAPTMFVKIEKVNRTTGRYEPVMNSKTGKPTWFCLNPKPKIGGNVQLGRAGYAHVLAGHALRDAQVRAEQLYEVHASTCEFADERREEQKLKRQRAARDRGMNLLFGR